jgi:ribosomal protein S18 acetylase RimI-like enzyme
MNAEISESSSSDSIVYTEEPSTKELEERVLEGFSQHAIQKIGYFIDPVSYAIVARRHGEIVGIIIMEAFWGALAVKFLWVSEECRRHSIGKSLMERAFEKGRKLECPFVYLETMSFQAVDFYKSLGFEENFVRHGYAHGTSFHYLQKNLNAEGDD